MRFSTLFGLKIPKGAPVLDIFHLCCRILYTDVYFLWGCKLVVRTRVTIALVWSVPHCYCNKHSSKNSI